MGVWAWSKSVASGSDSAECWCSIARFSWLGHPTRLPWPPLATVCDFAPPANGHLESVVTHVCQARFDLGDFDG